MSRPLLALCLILAALAAVPPLASARPNVVLIMTDDQTAASLPAMPQVNSLLAGQGTLFEQAIASFPLCCPSRATNLTGQYAHNHGVLHNNPPHGGYTALDHTNTLPVWLSGAGYRTMHVGRYLNRYEFADGIPPGWDDWYGSPHSGAFNYTNWKVNENGVLRTYPMEGRPDVYLTDYQTRRATELIDDAAPSDDPFYLSVWYTAPHRGQPRDPDDHPSPGSPSPAPRHRDAFAGFAMPRPPNFNEASMYDKPQVVADRPRFTAERIAGIEENWRQELESLLAVDEGVAQIVAALERSGELDNTLIVYLSDNGFMHGEHRALAEKVLAYEPSIRVPLVMRGPGIPVARVDRRLVMNADVPATILHATGVPAGRAQDGRSLIELSADPGREWGRDILIENGTGANGIPKYRGIRTYRFMYVEHRSTGERELYDLAEDPFQLASRDGFARYRVIQHELRRRLHALERCAGSSCRAHPHLKLILRSRGQPLSGCVRSDLRVAVGGAESRSVRRVDVMVGSRRVGRVVKPLADTLPLRGASTMLAEDVPRTKLRRHGRFRLRVRAETLDGRRLTLDRVLRACS